MALLLGQTEAVSVDEPCFLLVEVNLQSGLRGQGWRRYQILTVVRDDKLAQARIDLGPAAEHIASQFRVLGGVHDEITGRIEIYETVGGLRDLADYQRAGYFSVPEIAPSDLVGGYHDHLDKLKKALRMQSIFGPLHRVQRS